MGQAPVHEPGRRGARDRQGMFTVFETVCADPLNGGTVAPRIAPAMHPPVFVPAKGGPETFA
ncbi:MAG: hypothetical protein U0414_29180 [Polyangiaceae bacterium]